jgi:hypothetical protein
MRKEKKYHYIYKTTNLKNGKFYVGMHSTDNLNDGYLGSGTRLRRSIRRNGIENFKIEYLEFFNNRNDLANREKELVNENLLKDPMCMNLKIGGDGGFSKEINDLGRKIANIKRLELLKNDITFKKKFCDSVKTGIKISYNSGNRIKPISNGWSGRKHNQETKERMSNSRKGNGVGKNNSQFGTCWITNGKENKKINKNEKLLLGWEYGRTII